MDYDALTLIRPIFDIETACSFCGTPIKDYEDAFSLEKVYRNICKPCFKQLTTECVALAVENS